MRVLCRLTLLAGLLTVNLLSAIITFEVSEVGETGSGETIYRYTYSPSDFTLPRNAEIDIRFDPDLYGELLTGVAPLEFDLLLLQPDNPLGVPGDYSALAMADNPPLSGVFTVDFTFIGSGRPGAQPFFLNQYDDAGNFVRTIASGTTTPAGTVVPEPATGAAGCLILLVAGVVRVSRRRANGAVRIGLRQ